MGETWRYKQDYLVRSLISMWNEGTLGLLIICTGCISIVVIVRRIRWNDERFPPGPFAWPVIGHLRLFSHLPHQALAGLSKKYGHNILGLRLGQQRAVVVSSPEAAKEVLLTHDKVFAHRPPFLFTSLLHFGSHHGLIFSSPSAPQWRHHRKICVLQLFTAKRLQDLQYIRQQEMRALLLSLHHLSSAGTAPLDLGTCVGHMSSRILMRLVQSRPTAQVGDENLQQLIREFEQELLPTIGDLIPFLSCLDFFTKQRMRHIHARLDKVYTEILMERKESTSLHDDLLQALLSQEEPLTVVEIKSILHDIISAGIHTTALTLEWAMAELLRNPHCLHRLQREIDTHTNGKKELVSDADLPNLSYLKCIVKEVSRLHPVGPLLVPRMSIEECKLQGYIIPANTLMFVNVWGIGRDERVWPNANEFMPERFEGKNIDLKGKHFELLPFGSGRRTCLGMPLALSVIEVTLANLVSCFDWELPYGETHTSINMHEKTGITSNKATPVIVIPKPRVPVLELLNV